MDKDLSEELNFWLEGKDSLPIESVIKSLGMLLKQSNSSENYTGLTLARQNGFLVVQRVKKDSPSSNSSLAVNDEIIAINHYRVREIKDINYIIQPDEKALITFFRSGKLLQTSFIPHCQNKEHWKIEIDPNGSTASTKLRSKWMQII